MTSSTPEPTCAKCGRRIVEVEGSWMHPHLDSDPPNFQMDASHDAAPTEALAPAAPSALEVVDSPEGQDAIAAGRADFAAGRYESLAPAAPSVIDDARAAVKMAVARDGGREGIAFVMPFVDRLIDVAARVPGGAAGEALFQRGEFTLSSGQASTWKVECDALTPADWAGLARIAMERWDLQFSAVVGVPTGGVPFADALREFEDSWGPTLVVDDVLTTGESMRVEMAKYADSIGLVAFARGPLGPNVKAVWLANAPYGGAAGEALEAVRGEVAAFMMPGHDRERLIALVERAIAAARDALLAAAEAALVASGEERSFDAEDILRTAIAAARAPGPAGGEALALAELEERAGRGKDLSAEMVLEIIADARAAPVEPGGE